MLSQSLTGRASRRLAPAAGRLRKGHHGAHANDAAQAAAETLAAAPRPGPSRPGRNGQPRPQRANAPTARSKSQRGIGPREKVFGPGRLVPLDRNAKVRVMMVARALMRHQEKGKAYGKISAKALAVLTALLWRFHNAATGKCFPVIGGDRRGRRLRQARCTRRSAPLSRSASCPG